MQENINTNVYVTKTVTANATTTTGTTTILKPQGTQNSVCIDGGGKVVYRIPTTAPARESTTTTSTSKAPAVPSAWEKKTMNLKKRHAGGGNIVNDCLRMKVTLPPFWPAFLANIGICALLIGYIFIGSFLFMSIENDESHNIKQQEKQYAWHIVSSNPAYKLQQFQQQQEDIIIKEHYAHISNHTMNEVVLLKAATTTTNSLDSNIQQIAHTQRMLNVRDNFASDIDREFPHTSHINDAVEPDDVEAEERQRTVENIWEITVSLNILYKENWTRLAALELARFQNHLMKRLTLDFINNHHTRNPTANMKPVKEYYKKQSTLSARQVEWRFSTAFLYSLTLISTVGYGTLTPQTPLGRAVTIAYGTLGIPLMLIYLSSVGSILGKLMRFWCTGIFCCCSCCSESGRSKGKSIGHKRETKENDIQMKQPPPSSHLSYCYVRPPVDIIPETGAATTSNGTNSNGTNAQFSLGSSYDKLSIGTHDSRHANAFGWSLILPVLLCLLLWLFYITIGSIVISLLEQWPLIDGIYFCFMSLTTIGFCDLLPGLGGKSSISNDVLYPSYSSNIAVWFCAFYILIGLTLISMCVNMLHEELIWRILKLNTHPHGKDFKKKSAFYGGGMP